MMLRGLPAALGENPSGLLFNKYLSEYYAALMFRI